MPVPLATGEPASGEGERERRGEKQYQEGEKEDGQVPRGKE